VKLKPHEVTALARPISRQVARRPWLHRIIRDVTDPVLFAGTLGAIVRVRRRTIKAIKLGLIRMPSDPLNDLERARRDADARTRAQAHSGVPNVDAAPQPAPQSNVVPMQPPPQQPEEGLVRGPHVPHEEPLLRSAIAQLHSVG